MVVLTEAAAHKLVTSVVMWLGGICFTLGIRQQGQVV